jgi:DNA invertase Pin-like site-specific DNA recombinase
MTDSTKVKPSHTQRGAFVYIRQSSPSQVEYNRESTARQYALVQKACELGWAKEDVLVIDEDLGLSGSGSAKRSGFARMTAEVALGRVGIVLGLEVSRLARNNGHFDRRQRWALPSGTFQRSFGTRIERHHVGSRTSHPARTA